MTYDLNRGGDRSTEPADDDVIVGIPASGAPYTTSWSRVKGWIRRALSSTAPGNTPGSPSAGSSSEVARADHDHGITPGTSGGSGWTYDPAGLIDDIDDDTGGDIDFSRQGSGATSNLRGTIRDNAVERSMIANKSINASKLNDNAVTNAKIADDAVDTDQLADDAVTRAKIGSAAVGTTEIGTSAVTTAKIADDAITADKIADGVIPSNTGGGTSVAAHTPASGDDELAGIDIDGTDYEIVDRESRDRLHDVEQRVHPIREVPRTWTDITDTSAGWVVDDSLAPTYAGLSFAQTAVSGTSAQFVYVRVPVGARQSNYRFQYTVSGGAQNGETHNRVLGTWSGEQVASDSSWLYYRISFYEGDGFSAGKVQAGGSDSFEWEGSLTKDSVETQLDALGIPQQIDALKNVTRDLHLDGATKLVKNTAAATAGVARVAIANSALQAIEAGTQNLDVQGVTFTATLANAHFGTTATTTDKAIIRLAQTEDRSDWRILFDATAFLAGGWVPISVSNGTAGYDYYISGQVDRTTEIALYKSTEETTFHGELVDDSVTSDKLADSIVATLGRVPSANPGNNLVWKTDGSGAPDWRADATGGGGDSDFVIVADGATLNGLADTEDKANALAGKVFYISEGGGTAYTSISYDPPSDGGRSYSPRIVPAGVFLTFYQWNVVQERALWTVVRDISRIPTVPLRDGSDNNKVWKLDASGVPGWRADAGAQAGWTYDPEALIDDITDGTTGEIAFSRGGSGLTSTLKGSLKPVSVTGDKIQNDSVSTNKIADDAVTRAKIGAAAVGATELGTSAVTTAKIADDAVTTDKLANSINTVLGRVPSASPGNNQVWKTDGSGSPGWRPDATGGGSVAASPQELTPGTSTLQVGGATLGTAMPDNASTQIPITSVGTGTLASGLSSNNFTLKAGAYLIFVHLDEIWNTTSTTNALQYRSIVALEITGTLPAGAVHDPMPHYFRGAIQNDPAEAAGQAYVYLPEDTEIGLALVGYPGVGEDTGNADRNLNYHCTVDEVHIFPMGGVKGDKGDKGDAGTGASSFSELTGQIAASQIPDDVINKDMIASGAVTAVQVQSSAIINSKLAPNSVSADKIIDGVVSTAELADDAVTRAKIGDAAVGTDQLGVNAVTTAKIADDAVTRAKIGSQAVGSGELGNSAVTTAKLDNVAVTTAKIADDAVTADKIADGVIPDIPDTEEVYGSNTIRKDDTGVLKLRAPDLHSGFWGRSGDDNIVPLGADDPANAVPARLTEVRSNDTRSTAKLSDVVYEATGPQGSPEVEGTIKVLHSTGTFIHDFGSGAGYDATKPGFTWDATNNRFAHNGVAPSVANSGSTDNKFRLRVEVDYMHHVTVGTSEFSMQLDIDVPQRYGVDRQHQWHNISTDLGDDSKRTLSYQVDISATTAPATTDHLTVKLTSLQLGSQVEFVEAVRIHFILPDSANISYLQEYDLSNVVSWVGRNVLGPALGSHTDNQSNAGVKITGGRMIATEDLATLQLISNARTGVAGNGHNIRLMTRIPGLQVPIVLHEWDDSTNVWRIVETIKGVVQEQEVWIEADSGATYSSVGSPNFVWDSTKHDSDVDDNLLYPGLIRVLTQAQYDALSWVNPYQIYFIEA